MKSSCFWDYPFKARWEGSLSQSPLTEITPNKQYGFRDCQFKYRFGLQLKCKGKRNLGMYQSGICLGP